MTFNHGAVLLAAAFFAPAAAFAQAPGQAPADTSGRALPGQVTGAPATGGTPVNAPQNQTGPQGSGAVLSSGGARLQAGGSIAPPGSENDRAPRTFTLEETIAAALRTSAAIQVARRNVEIDRQRTDEVASQGRLNVTGSASATRYDQATQIQFNPQSPPITTLPVHQEALSLSVNQPLDFSGQIRAATNQARLQSLADEFSVRQQENERALIARRVYFNRLRADHQVSVAQAALRSAQAQLAIAQRLFDAGVGQKIDTYRARTLVAQNEQALARAENARNLARSDFNNLVGRPLDAPSSVVDVPGVTVGEDVRAPAPIVGAPAPSVFTPFRVAPGELAVLDLDRSAAAALTQRPELLAFEIDVRAAETGIRVARGGSDPTFALRASGNYYPTPSFQFPRQRVAALTAQVNLPLFDGGLTRDRVAEARLRAENARTTLASARADVFLLVRQAFDNLRTAARQIDAASVALEQAVAARQLAQVRYEGQVGLFLEVTDAQAALVRAENDQVNAVYDYLIARAEFENAVGGPVAPVPPPLPNR